MDKNPDNIEKSTTSELLVADKQINEYRQIFQKEGLQKKKQYLLAIKEHNRNLVDKIKHFNEKVNQQINSIVNKIVPKKKTSISKFEGMETKELKQKFQEYEKLKRQIQTKRSGTDSLQFLFTVKKKYEAKLSQITKEIFAKKKQISQLKKIKEKSLSSDEVLKNQLAKVGDLDIYAPDIQILKMKVREKSDNLRAKKEEFLGLYKQNKSNKSIVLEDTSKIQEVKQEDPQLAKLKCEYQAIGKRVQVLKLKKSCLSNQVKAESENIKKLEKLKARYDILAKLQSP